MVGARHTIIYPEVADPGRREVWLGKCVGVRVVCGCEGRGRDGCVMWESRDVLEKNVTPPK